MKMNFFVDFSKEPFLCLIPLLKQTLNTWMSDVAIFNDMGVEKIPVTYGNGCSRACKIGQEESWMCDTESRRVDWAKMIDWSSQKDDFLKRYRWLPQRRQEGRRSIKGEVCGRERLMGQRKGLGARGKCNAAKTTHLGGNRLECWGFLCCCLNQHQNSLGIQEPFSLNLMTGEDEQHMLHCATHSL